MKKIYILLVSLCLPPSFSIWSSAAYISYDPHKAGRTGDKLIQYTKALWVAFQYKMPFIYTPFKNSDQLQLHYLTEPPATNIQSSVTVTKPSELSFEANIKNLISYYFQDMKWADRLNVTTWKGLIDNQPFLTLLKKHISPTFKIKKHTIPKDHISVAVHVRKGCGGDHPQSHAAKLWPMKFPPDSYYIDQIKKLSSMLNDRQIYVYIFTDHSTPTQLVEHYKNAVRKKNIVYNCQKNNVNIDNPLSDFFTMTQYDCLIRGGSNFSQMVHLVGNFEIVIYLHNAYWSGNNMILDSRTIDNRYKK